MMSQYNIIREYGSRTGKKSLIAQYKPLQEYVGGRFSRLSVEVSDIVVDRKHPLFGVLEKKAVLSGDFTLFRKLYEGTSEKQTEQGNSTESLLAQSASSTVYIPLSRLSDERKELLEECVDRNAKNVSQIDRIATVTEIGDGRYMVDTGLRFLLENPPAEGDFPTKIYKTPHDKYEIELMRTVHEHYQTRLHGWKEQLGVKMHNYLRWQKEAGISMNRREFLRIAGLSPERVIKVMNDFARKRNAAEQH